MAEHDPSAVLQAENARLIALLEANGIQWRVQQTERSSPASTPEPSRLPYAAINLDGADVQIRERKAQGLGRNEVAIGEVVGFVDRDQQERSGRIIRLNDKTVTLRCGQQQWRVAYCFLHRVVDADGIAQNVLEIDGTPMSEMKSL